MDIAYKYWFSKDRRMSCNVSNQIILTLAVLYPSK